jgi:uroporphyrinogen decarboxylase
MNMLPRERVIDVIEYRKPDRTPIYGWVRENLEKPITDAFGSVDAFEDYYEFDLAHIFGGPKPYSEKELEEFRIQRGKPIEPSTLLDFAMNNPDDFEAYEKVKQAINHHKIQRGRFTYMQTPGIFEYLNDIFGFENHLTYLLLNESELNEVYRRQAEWNRKFAMNCLDLGIDMIHVSDDWGSQRDLLFSPDIWWKLIYPYHKITCDAVRKRNAYLSLHSDGNISKILDGIIELGYQVLHPFQESAGMDFKLYKQQYADSFVIMGGLDVQTTIGFGDYNKLQYNIERVLEVFKDGGLLFCTSHFIQEHCTIEELRFAYDLIFKLIRQSDK